MLNYFADTPLALCLGTASAWAFDHQHTAWDRLLGQHVVWTDGGTAAQVHYAGFQADHAQLTAYLDALSAVTHEEFANWTKAQQLAFLINAYNAFTIELILTRYPRLDSIKDLGSLFGSPWKKRFFTLLGQERSLDEIEHGLIRAKGVYDEPRIHVALVCASIGCPALRNEAFVAVRLDAQLEDSLIRFLSDKSRNRYDPASNTLKVSEIFDWYEEDFSRGPRGVDSLNGFFAAYAHLLADTPEQQHRIRAGQVTIVYLPYDWDLNDVVSSRQRNRAN